MKLTITRAEVRKALRTEILHPGSFAMPVRDAFSGADTNEFCSVCAVGSVLRNRLPHADPESLDDKAQYIVAPASIPITGFDLDMDDAVEDTTVNKLLRKGLDNKEYLAVLSLKFETLCAEAGISGGRDQTPRYLNPTQRRVRTRKMNQVRATLARYVSRHFPESFKVTL